MNDEGGVQALEAVIAGIIVFTNVILIVMLDAPSFARDIGEDSDDAFAQTVLDTVAAPYASNVDPWLDGLMDDTGTARADTATDIEAFLAPGQRYALRLQTGNGPIHILPTEQQILRPGGAGAMVVAPGWRDHQATSPSDTTWPGQSQPWGGSPASFTCVEDPRGSQTRADGLSWADIWNDDLTSAPRGVFYGHWRAATSGGCGGAPVVNITLAAGQTSHYAPYMLELVISDA